MTAPLDYSEAPSRWQPGFDTLRGAVEEWGCSVRAENSAGTRRGTVSSKR
jgi:hypothetical protein